jgi:hypothetical protein
MSDLSGTPRTPDTAHVSAAQRKETAMANTVKVISAKDAPAARRSAARRFTERYEQVHGKVLDQASVAKWWGK